MDIHSRMNRAYVRNYNLLHKLYDETKYPPLEKAKQFLHGINNDRYSDAVAQG